MVEFLSINRGQEFPHLRSNAVLVRNQGFIALVDCGSFNDRELIINTLFKNGVSPSKVELLILTHLHYDHCENIDLFPKAAIVVNQKEIEFLEKLLIADCENEIKELLFKSYNDMQTYYLRNISKHILNNRKDYESLLKYDKKRLIKVEDPENKDFGNLIKIIDTPGHSVGHISVEIKTQKPTIIAGDAVISLDSWRKRKRQKPHICWSMEQYQASLEKIESYDATVIPGHGLPFDLIKLNSVSFNQIG